jgi:hypothetical protein
LFESVGIDEAPARMRAAALPPLAAFVVAVVYLAVYPLFGSVPPLLFWLVAAVVMELVCLRLLLGMVLPWL